MLVENEYFKLFVKNTDVIIYPKKLGYSLKNFDTIFRQYPRLKLHSFPTLVKSFTKVGDEHVIGEWKPLIEITVSPDHMEVEALVHATEEEVNESKDDLVEEITLKLDQLNIHFGRENIREIIVPKSVAFIVAKGRQAVQGDDAKIAYIERPERKPVIREDGSANYYDMNFVFLVEKDDWLGEKIHAQPGKAGMDVFGNEIPAPSGNDMLLQYDKKSVYSKEEKDKTILYAKHSGTLEYNYGEISIGSLLVIEEDVGPETGDIKFNGAVTIHGTVHAGYSVIATGDISIESKEGITHAKVIQSATGDVFIKGGVFGNDETKVEAAGKIFLKHANNCKLQGKEVHVGLYLFGTEVTADKVFLDPQKGKIIGGLVEALFKVEAAIIGNIHERRTTIRVTGIDRKKYRETIRQQMDKFKEKQEVLIKIENYIEAMARNTGKLSYEQQKTFDQAKSSKEALHHEIETIHNEMQFAGQMLKITEKPEVLVTQNVYPGTIIEIGKKIYSIKHETQGVFKDESKHEAN